MKILKSVLFFISISVSYLTAQGQNPKHEFRAAWVATVGNIDWPSRKGLPVEVQKAEFIRLLEMHLRNRMNAVIVQIRPVADAFYPSELEPWSEYLTGVQGQAPVPFYDPLKFMIEETHKRNMEFHAWCNPYRAVFNAYKTVVAPNHITRIQKGWFVTYGNDKEGVKKYFDPGNPDAQKFVIDVVKDIVTRYDIDAIHFDDYFYPYKVPGKDFPDAASYAKYGAGMAKDDWRRSNCDSVIKKLSIAIKAIKPYVKFGVSPFGVWRNKSQDPEGSDTRAGVTNYDDLYADILLWQKKGWIDYVLPQCYWEIGFARADYETLVDWWAGHAYGKHIYIGHGIYRAGSNAAWRDRNQIPEQIQILREYEDIQGSAYFSSKIFEKNPNGWNDSLQKNYYSSWALVPPMPWIDSVPPPNPTFTKNGKGFLVKKGIGSERLRSFIIYAFTPGQPDGDEPSNIVKVIEGGDELIVGEQFLADYPGKQLGVSVLDWGNNESGVILLK